MAIIRKKMRFSPSIYVERSDTQCVSDVRSKENVSLGLILAHSFIAITFFFCILYINIINLRRNY